MPPEEETPQETEEETTETEETEETEKAETPETNEVDSPPEDQVKPVTPFDPAKPVPPSATPIPASPPSFHELKVLIIMKGESVMLGVQATDCDPVYTTMTGDLAAALQRVPTLVDEAKKRWSANPLYPKANLPEPEPAPAPVRRAATTPKTTTPAAPKAQPKFF